MTVIAGAWLLATSRPKFGPEAARAFGRVAASLRATGRKPRARAFDALIAAAAMAEGIPVYTCNPSDLDGIEGLAERAVPHPDAGQATA